jgi:hypothetical protein
MSRRFRPRLTYANVMATLAFFLALTGGTAWAVNEWTGANIQDETLTGADVKGVNGTSTVKGVNGTLTGADISGQPSVAATGQPFVNGSLSTYDIADGGLRAQDLQANTLTGAQINESTLGQVPTAASADSAAKLGGVDASAFAHRLFVRATFFSDGTIYSQVGTGTIAYAGSPGQYTVTFPDDVSKCAAVATVNRGLNGGFSASDPQTTRTSYGPDFTTQLDVTISNAQSGAGEWAFGLNVVVIC